MARYASTVLSNSVICAKKSSEFIAADISKLGECEFYLISEMNCQLIVHHPYRTLVELQNTLNLAQDEVSLSWSIINDHYLTDLPLLHPPHIIAVTAIFLALVLRPSQGGVLTAGSPASILANISSGTKESLTIENFASGSPQGKVQFLVKWLAESEIDIKAMAECTQEIISLYDVWERYKEKDCKEQIARFARTRGSDK